MKNSVHTWQMFAKMYRYLQLSNLPESNLQYLKKRYFREFLHDYNIKINCTGQNHIRKGPLLILSNHISYLDILVYYNVFAEASFVSKAEVKTWPIIGSAATRVNTVYVKREDSNSRTNTRTAITNALIHEKKQIILFPSGTTTIVPTQRWKKGSFEIAYETGTPVLPVRLKYRPLRPVAYIDKDVLFFHLINLKALGKIEVDIEIGESRMIQSPEKDCDDIRKWCEEKL